MPRGIELVKLLRSRIAALGRLQPNVRRISCVNGPSIEPGPFSARVCIYWLAFTFMNVVATPFIDYQFKLGKSYRMDAFSPINTA